MLQIKDFTTEYRTNPIGIDAKEPRFSWKLSSDENDVYQKSYRITVTEAGAMGENDNIKVWDSGIIDEETSVAVRYEGAELKPCREYAVKLEVTDNKGNSAFGDGLFAMGLMTYDNMKASFITHGFEDELEAPAIFSKKFKTENDIKNARLYASALGIYEFTVNGLEGSDVKFAPGWTAYQDNLQYQTYDITDLIKSGAENAISFTVGNGWYKGILGFFNQGNHYGKRTGIIAQIVISYCDGSEQLVCTDETWDTYTGEIRYSEIYHGEIIDKTFECKEIKKAALLEQDKAVLIAQQDEPCRITERIAGREFIISPKGEYIIDFGQNLTGVVEFSLKGKRGQKIILKHAETLDKDGNFYTVNLRTAKCTDTFICSGGEDFFRPKFTYHGFRYISIEGMDRQDINQENFTACVIHTDLKKTGDFNCNDEMVNRLIKNIDWGLRDNFLDIPTDCPQRDERLGYTGDTQIFLSTASVIRDVRLFYEKYLRDLRYEQKIGEGGIPTTVPNILGQQGGIAIWHDAGTIIPWTLYENYGDVRILEESFDSMVSCVEYSKKLAGNEGLIKTGQQLGDWVSMDVPRGAMLNYTGDVWNLQLTEKIGATDPYYIANVYYVNSISLTARAARVLGKEKEALEYEKLYEETLAKIRDEYITKNGRVISDTQTGNVMALFFDIAEEKDREVCRERLIANLKLHKNHLTTGFAGTPFLCPTLSEVGEHELAGAVFMQKDCPSWLYHVKMGATTMWELWDGVNPDGSFNGFEMNSFNHYSYGSIGNWVYHYLLGITALEPGYKKIRIEPRMIMGLPDMEGFIDTVYGTVRVVAKCLDRKYSFDITIPANTSAIIELPEREAEEKGSGTYHYEYETESSFVPERYNMDTVFGELLDNPAGKAMFEQYAPDLMSNDMFLMFAMQRPIVEVLGMLPGEAAGLVKMVMKTCNDNPVTDNA